MVDDNTPPTTTLKQHIYHNSELERAKRMNLNILFLWGKKHSWDSFMPNILFVRGGILVLCSTLKQQPNRVACDNHTSLLSWTQPNTIDTNFHQITFYNHWICIFAHTLSLSLCYSANINSGFNTNSKNHSHFICDFIFGGLSVTNENYHNNDGNKTDGFTVQGLYDTVFFSPFFQQVRISLTFFLYRILHIENVIANNYYMVAQLRFFFFSLVVVWIFYHEIKSVIQF